MGFSFDAKYEIWEEGPVGSLLYTLPAYSHSLQMNELVFINGTTYKVEKVTHAFVLTSSGSGGDGFAQPVAKVEVSVVV